MSHETRVFEVESATGVASGSSPVASNPPNHHHHHHNNYHHNFHHDNHVIMDSLASVTARRPSHATYSVLETETTMPRDMDDDGNNNNNNNKVAAAAASHGTKSKKKKASTTLPTSSNKKVKATTTKLSSPSTAPSKAKKAAQDKENQQHMDDDDDDNNNIYTEDGDLPEDHIPKTATAATTTLNKKQQHAPTTSHHNKTFVQLAHDAIVSLNDRSGSSQVAITKYLLQKHPELEQQTAFKSRFPNALKMAVKSQRFVKVKASYKINVEWKKQQEKQRKMKTAALAKKKKEMADATTLATASSKVQDLDQPPLTPSETVAKAKRDEHVQRKGEEERVRKERADRLRKRRFPMEDTKLHAEDKELSVKPPETIQKTPLLPYFFACTLPLKDPRRKGKTPSNILTASKCDGIDVGSRGLVPDLLTVYHFFRGDVHYYQFTEDVEGNGGGGGVVPEFSLQHLVFAVQEVMNGNAKRSKLIPPLLSHLFVTCLQILLPCMPPTEKKSKNDTSGTKVTNMNHNNNSNNDVDATVAAQKQLAKDLSRLSIGLCPASWADICFLYMDTMERYCTSTASTQNYFLPGLDVLPGLHIDSRYLLHATNSTLEPMTPAKMDDGEYLPAGYYGYLGDARGALGRAHAKLLKQDPWNLTAEELMALLRALVDDVLASSPEIADDIAQREELMTKLLKEKKAADSNFRKIRLGFEGPKKMIKKTTAAENGKDASDGAEDTPANEDSADAKDNKGGDDGKKPQKEWKPTASKRQFEAALKSQQKANDAYEKGVRNLVARTEPVGYDRNFNAVYCFRHDPEALYVEVVRPSMGSFDGIPDGFQSTRSSWHIIETKSLFDQYVSSLDVRGKREKDLLEGLVGQPGTLSLRASLFDDIKERSSASARRKELVDLKRRLENAKIKCDENRHSGRLAGRAVVELSQLETEMKDLERQIKGKAEPVALNFEELTGLELLRQFDSTETFKSRSSRSKKEAAPEKRARMPCSVLWPTGELDGTGVVGSIVTELVSLEERCDALAPVEDQSLREEWITDLEDAVLAWNNGTTVVLGTGKTPPVSSQGQTVQFVGDASLNSNQKVPADQRRRSFGSMGSMGSISEAKRRRIGSPTPSQISSSNNLSNAQIIALIKKPLLALEDRVFQVTGLAMAASDLDLADDNMSDDENDEGRSSQAWKRSIHRLKSIQARKHAQVREAVTEAIGAARRAQNGAVVAQLRSALMLHHPSACGGCKSAALEVLENHGGYDPEDDDQDDDEVNGDVKKLEDSDDACLLAEEAVVMDSSLDGNEYAGRVDWIEAVKSCKTFSKLGSLICAFVRRASDKLGKLETEKKALLGALSAWAKEEERKQRNRNNTTKYRKSDEKTFSTTEVWANVRFTDEYCMVKLDADPWWPAKKCNPNAEQLAESLASVNRTLVSLLGEEGALRVVTNDNIKPFTGKPIDEDMKEYSKEVRKQLSEAMAMGRRIVRGLERMSQKSNDKA